MDQFQPVTIERPQSVDTLPLLCDSPHSGTWYPPEFGHAISKAELRSGEDTHIDALWSHAPKVGATLICAQFPRTYIDPNRPQNDIDVGMLDAPWPHPVVPSEQTARGYGLVWKQVRDGAPIYARKLSVAELRTRIDTCWQPYHRAVASEATALHERWGALWHLNLHSMPHNAYERLGIASTTPLADFVLGDLDGSSCEPGFVQMLGDALKACGYSVARNDPYKGLELLRRTGKPDEHRHSVQVEINRSIYMNEITREANAHFGQLRSDLMLVMQSLSDHVRQRLREMEA